MSEPINTPPFIQLEIRPEMRNSVEFRLLCEALLAAAREELDAEDEGPGQHDRRLTRRLA